MGSDCCCEDACLAWSDDLLRDSIGPDWFSENISQWSIDDTQGLQTSDSGAAITAAPAAIASPPGWTHTQIPNPNKIQITISANSGDEIKVQLAAYSASPFTWNVGSSVSLGNRTCEFTDTDATFVFCLSSSGDLTVASGTMQISTGTLSVAEDWYDGSTYPMSKLLLGISVVTATATIYFTDVFLSFTDVAETVTGDQPNCRSCFPCCWPNEIGGGPPNVVNVTIEGFTTGVFFGCSDAECAALNGEYELEYTYSNCSWELTVNFPCDGGTTITTIRLYSIPDAEDSACQLAVDFLDASDSLIYRFGGGTGPYLGACEPDDGCDNGSVILGLAINNGGCNGSTWHTCPPVGVGVPYVTVSV